MARLIDSVRVIGLGKVGELVATLLADAGFSVTALDARVRTGLPFATAALDVHDAAALADALTGADAVVSCLPYHLNLPVAEAAYAAGVHYFDLTEDVPTTNRVLELAAKGGDTVLAPLRAASASADGLRSPLWHVLRSRLVLQMGRAVVAGIGRSPRSAAEWPQ